MGDPIGDLEGILKPLCGKVGRQRGIWRGGVDGRGGEGTQKNLEKSPKRTLKNHEKYAQGTLKNHQKQPQETSSNH